jgi:glycosyltransferase involved in cell wall biosynthesis
MKIPEFSVIITSLNEERSLGEFFSRLLKTLEKISRSYEIILVNDGSTDRTFEIQETLFHQNPSISHVIDFFKNSGQDSAISAAIPYSLGKNFILIDSDLQLSPEELPILLKEFDGGVDLVTGYRKNRKDALSRKGFSLITNFIFRKISGKNLRDFGCTFKIVHGNIMRSFNYGPHNTIKIPDIVWAAGSVAEVPVSHQSRAFGKSGFTFGKMTEYFLANFISISSRPFQYLSLILLTLASLFVLRILIGIWIPGSFLYNVSNGLILNSSVISTLTTLGLLCFLGELVMRDYRQTHGRPKFIIKRVLSKNKSQTI